MKRYKSINGLIRILGGQVREAQALMKALKVKPKTTEQTVLLKYIETRSTPKTARFMREEGVKSPSRKSFMPADVSALITAGHPSLNAHLLKFAREIFKRNKKNVQRRYD